MKSEELDKFIGKNVKLTFDDKTTDEGIFGNPPITVWLLKNGGRYD